MTYVWRTHDMCFFDKVPIWREEGIEDEDCKGQAEDIYYYSLVIIHFYLLLEFTLRVLMEKY